MREINHHSEQASSLGSLLKADREKAQLSLTAYAASIGISRTYLSRLERGVYQRPSPRIVAQIARNRNLCMSDLFALCGYLFPDDLPSFMPYVRAKCQGWPEEAIKELVDCYLYVKYKHSLDD
jgi:transcriptional regulator with XRE-family HTH domain